MRAPHRRPHTPPRTVTDHSPGLRRRLVAILAALATALAMAMVAAPPASAAATIALSPAGGCTVRVTVTGVTDPLHTWLGADPAAPVRISGDGTYLVAVPWSNGTDPVGVNLYRSDDPYGFLFDSTDLLADSSLRLAPCGTEPPAHPPVEYSPLPPVDALSITLQAGPRCGTVRAKVTGTSRLPEGESAVAQVTGPGEAVGDVPADADGIYVVPITPGATQITGAELLRVAADATITVADTDTATVPVTACATPRPQVPAGGYRATGTFGNHTGDRLADVYAVKPNGAVDLYLGQPTSATLLDRGALAPTTLTGVTALAQIGDWNGDHRSDLLVRAADKNLWIHTSTATGGLTKWRQVGANWGVMDQIVFAGNLKGGTTQYVVARRSDNGDLYRYTMTASGLTGTTRIGHGWQAMSHLVSVGDFNGDGRSDIIAVRNDGTLWIYQGTTTGTLAPGRQVGHGWSGFTQIFSPGDISGDGRFDLLGVDSTGALRGYHNGGNGWWSASVTLGTGFGQYRLMA